MCWAISWQREVTYLSLHWLPSNVKVTASIQIIVWKASCFRTAIFVQVKMRCDMFISEFKGEVLLP